METLKLKLPILIATLLFGCSPAEPPKEPVDPVRESIEAYVLPRMNDPQSYEFVLLELVDSLTHAQDLEQKWEAWTRAVERAENHLPVLVSLARMDKESEQVLARERRNLERDRAELDSLNRLQPAPGNVYRTYLFTARGTNALGVKVLQRYRMKLSPDNVVQAAEPAQ